MPGLEALEIPHILATTPEPFAVPAELVLSVRREGRVADPNGRGYAPEAAPGMDSLDQYAPPGYFEAASLRVVKKAAGRVLALAGEYRPRQDMEQPFELLLDAPVHSPLTLEVEGIDAFAGYEVHLVDRARAVSYDLHEQPSVTVLPQEEQTYYSLVLGRASFVDAALEELMPATLELETYPNPFHAQTQLAYTVPPSASDEPVRLEIFDVTGRKVYTLLDEVQAPGRYRIAWDGKDGAGLSLPSGVYFCRLQSGTQVRVQKMVLLR